MPIDSICPDHLLYPPAGGESRAEKKVRVDAIMEIKRDHTPEGETSSAEEKRVTKNANRRRYYMKKDTESYMKAQRKSSQVYIRQ